MSYETVRRWFLKFGSIVTANLKQARLKPSDHWHLDEMAVVIRGQRRWRQTAPFSGSGVFLT